MNATQARERIKKTKNIYLTDYDNDNSNYGKPFEDFLFGPNGFVSVYYGDEAILIKDRIEQRKYDAKGRHTWEAKNNKKYEWYGNLYVELLQRPSGERKWYDSILKNKDADIFITGTINIPYKQYSHNLIIPFNLKELQKAIMPEKNKIQLIEKQTSCGYLLLPDNNNKRGLSIDLWWHTLELPPYIGTRNNDGDYQYEIIDKETYIEFSNEIIKLQEGGSIPPRGAKKY